MNSFLKNGFVVYLYILLVDLIAQFIWNAFLINPQSAGPDAIMGGIVLYSLVINIPLALFITFFIYLLSLARIVNYRNFANVALFAVFAHSLFHIFFLGRDYGVTEILARMIPAFVDNFSQWGGFFAVAFILYFYASIAFAICILIYRRTALFFTNH